jgi:hypothetical protein
MAAQRQQQEIAMEAMRHQAEMTQAQEEHQQSLVHNQQTQDLQAKQQLLQMMLNANNRPKGE